MSIKSLLPYSIVCLLFLSIFTIEDPCLAQTTDKIDSLKMQLNDTEEKTHVDLLNQISREFWQNNYDSAYFYAQEALKISAEIRYDKGIADAYNRIGNIWYFRQSYDSAMHYYQKALTLRKEQKEPHSIAGIYNNIAILYVAKKQMDIAIEFYHKAYEASRIGKNSDDMLIYANSLAFIYESNNNYTKAIEYYLLTQNIAHDNSKKLEEAIASQNISNIYRSINAYDKALEYSIKALKIFESTENIQGVSTAYNSIGIIHKDLGNLDKAIEYYQKALAIDQTNNFTQNMSAVFNNLGIIYDDKGDKLKALEYYKKSIAYDNEENIRGKATALNNIGLIQHDLGNQEKALENLLKSLALSEEISAEYSIANTCNNIAKVYITENKTALAQNFLDRALSIAKQIKALPLQEEAYQLLGKLKEKQKRHNEALFFYKEYTRIHDSIYQQRMNQNIAETQVKFETETVEQENEILRKDNEIQKLAIQKQKVIKNLLFGFTALILALLTLIYSRFTLKKQTTSLLKKKNHELKKANKKLAASESNLKELNATKDKFFSIIAHDLKNPFQALLGFSEIIYSRAHDLTPEELEEYAKAINDSAQNLFNLLGNLLQWSRTQLGSTNIKPEPILLEKAIKEVTETLSISAKEKNILIQIDIPDGIQVMVDKNALLSVLRNLISNAIKFTYPKGNITIMALSTKPEIVEIAVKDSGKGIAPKDLDKLFKIDSNFSTKGTANEQGTGLGLILSKELINKSGGEISAESEEGIGSIFRFTLPNA